MNVLHKAPDEFGQRPDGSLARLLGRIRFLHRDLSGLMGWVRAHFYPVDPLYCACGCRAVTVSPDGKPLCRYHAVKLAHAIVAGTHMAIPKGRS